MAMPVEKVEIGFDLTDTPVTRFFTLDDATAGRLDNTQYRLAGTTFIDVTEYVKSFQISRGKPRRFSSFPAGAANVTFNNHSRAFDPTYELSPFAGQIIPRREIRITSGTAIQFQGYIDDWNLTYTVDGNSVADALAKDSTSILAKQVIAAGTPTEQYTGERIAEVLDDPGVNWATDARDLETGRSLVGTQEITANTNALTYMQKVAETEPGLFFVNKTGDVAFRDSLNVARSNDLTVFGQGTAIPYSGIQVIYGAELLYNQITIANVGGGTAVASDIESQNTYGIRDLIITDLLGASDLQAVDLAVKYADLYSEPEYRVEALDIQVHKLEPAQQVEALELEIGDVCKVEFTPNGIGDAIERFIQVISISHDVNPEIHIMRLAFQQIKYLPLVLDDAIFGKLDVANLG
jgi:hypothetical protein